MTAEGNTRRRRRLRKARTETDRGDAIAACRRHLADLRRAYPMPPPCIEVSPSSVPVRVVAAPLGSWCGSAAQLCADLA